MCHKVGGTGGCVSKTTGRRCPSACSVWSQERQRQSTASALLSLSLSLRLRAQAASRPGFSLSLSLSQELHLRDPRESITHTKNKNQPNPTYADLLPCRSSYKDNNFKAASSKEDGVTLLVLNLAPGPPANHTTTRPVATTLSRLALDLVVSHLKWFPLAVLGGAPVPPPPLAAAGLGYSPHFTPSPSEGAWCCIVFFFLRPRKRFILSSTFNRGTPEEVPSSNPNSSGSVRFLLQFQLR